ncbi:hypothetical protein IQ07DRAFT_602082 [Pyrenochaeta sp. DS3sAY3a]|nr:hypothetical protein IQ07DRAFT_602082 [Pyrenochaeta sp. DS3sAY3a]
MLLNLFGYQAHAYLTTMKIDEKSTTISDFQSPLARWSEPDFGHGQYSREANSSALFINRNSLKRLNTALAWAAAGSHGPTTFCLDGVRPTNSEVLSPSYHMNSGLNLHSMYYNFYAYSPTISRR